LHEIGGRGRQWESAIVPAAGRHMGTGIAIPKSAIGLPARGGPKSVDMIMDTDMQMNIAGTAKRDAGALT
jgi:hypothetical protein